MVRDLELQVCPKCAPQNWRRRRVEPSATLALLELVASEAPDLLTFTIESLSSSPARRELLQVAKDFGVEQPQLIERFRLAVYQLNRLEAHAVRWKEPQERFGQEALPAALLARVASARSDRWRRKGKARPSELVRVDRRLAVLARRERPAELVREILEEKPRSLERERAERLVRDLLKGKP